MSVTIRRANPDDVNAIASILLEAFEEFRPLYTDGGFAATTPSASIILARLEEGPSGVALLDNQILGTVSAVATSDGLYVRSVGVTPSARGTGIARAPPLDAVEAYATDQGFPGLASQHNPISCFGHSAL
jgi:ribosomal protein S18 acetylase RimI-like enzyme